MSSVSGQYNGLTNGELSVGPYLSETTGADKRLSLPPIPDDVTNGNLFLHGMPGAYANLLSKTNIDDNNIDDFFSAGQTDQLYRQHFPLTTSF